MVSGTCAPRFSQVTHSFATERNDVTDLLEGTANTAEYGKEYDPPALNHRSLVQQLLLKLIELVKQCGIVGRFYTDKASLTVSRALPVRLLAPCNV